MQIESRTHNQSADRFPQLLAMAPKWQNQSINPETELLLTDWSEKTVHSVFRIPSHGFRDCDEGSDNERNVVADWLKGWIGEEKLQVDLHRVGSIVVFWPGPGITNQSCNHPKIASQKSLLNNYEWRCRHGCDDDEWQWVNIHECTSRKTKTKQKGLKVFLRARRQGGDDWRPGGERGNERSKRNIV